MDTHFIPLTNQHQSECIVTVALSISQSVDLTDVDCRSVEQYKRNRESAPFVIYMEENFTFTFGTKRYRIIHYAWNRYRRCEIDALKKVVTEWNATYHTITIPAYACFNNRSWGYTCDKIAYAPYECLIIIQVDTIIQNLDTLEIIRVKTQFEAKILRDPDLIQQIKKNVPPVTCLNLNGSITNDDLKNVDPATNLNLTTTKSDFDTKVGQMFQLLKNKYTKLNMAEPWICLQLITPELIEWEYPTFFNRYKDKITQRPMPLSIQKEFQNQIILDQLNVLIKSGMSFSEMKGILSIMFDDKFD